MLFETPKDDRRAEKPSGSHELGLELELLRLENASLKARNEHLARELSQARQGIVATPSDKDADEGSDDVTDDALRKRLERLCKRDGKGCPCFITTCHLLL